LGCCWDLDRLSSDDSSFSWIFLDWRTIFAEFFRDHSAKIGNFSWKLHSMKKCFLYLIFERFSSRFFCLRSVKFLAKKFPEKKHIFCCFFLGKLIFFHSIPSCVR
jgi:hypothetical protein